MQLELGGGYVQISERLRSLAKRALAVLALACASSVAQAAELVAFRPLVLQGSHVKWSADPTSGVALTYAFVETAVTTPDASNCRDIAPLARVLHTSALDLASVRRAFAAAAERWQRVANIRFTETTDQAAANILIGEQMQPVGRAFANVALRDARGGSPREIARSTICLNPEHRWKIGFDGNLAVYDLVHTFTHELGHAIGLDHPMRAGQLMSPRYDEKIVGLTASDIAGAIALYGRPRDLRGLTSQASAFSPITTMP